ncbi:OmpA family protein [Bergeriella denitrificans]|uniref:Lipoprotein n=1 Tax=Bergeriella denitrificans TaxID=494 RepID=A0A378UIR9_BERDE|nr:OmpA family protein [Bergeriella denitrificans]STZ77258.1 lipoprotein [Bergeriella denitrificans]
MKILTFLGTGAAALALTACSSLSPVTAEGMTDAPVFPATDKATVGKRAEHLGTFPDPSALAQIRAGMSREQVYTLLGEPHYNEGVRVREWDYLLNFNTPRGVQTCQYKITFDQSRLAQGFYWNPVTPNTHCAALAKPGTPAQAPRNSFTFTDTFTLNSYQLGDMTANGRQQLQQAASAIKSLNAKTVMVVGHTDRLGSDAYNLDLSKKRAETVADYFIAQGVPAHAVHSTGEGKSQPVVQCDANAPLAQQVECLKPNRRVVVKVYGE